MMGFLEIFNARGDEGSTLIGETVQPERLEG